MAKKERKEKSEKPESPATKLTVRVKGIHYEEFAAIKWQQFLRIYTLIVLLVLAVVIFSVVKNGTATVSLSTVLVIVAVLAVILLVFRSAIKSEYRRSGLKNMEIDYHFDKHGWTAENALGKAEVKWKNTPLLRRTKKALLLYPNKKSVNLLPLRCLTEEELRWIVEWYQK